MDQLAFAEKSGWVERAAVILQGEIARPGVYVIDRGETLCQVMERAGGLTGDAYSFGAYFTRESVRTLQQETIDSLHDQLDDLMVDLSLSHSFNNSDKSAPEWAGKQDYLKTIRQLERAEANGRMVIDLPRAMTCKGKYDLPLEDGDTLTVPSTPDFVQVAGQVYVPTSHLFEEDRSIIDYVEMSGGHTLLGQMNQTYVIQANGEVLNFKGSRTSSKLARKTVQPGARIYVPLNVDRMNVTEKAQTWVQTLVNSAILAGVVL
jgi:protein involved in polysaccharide export with SLBB domain